MPFTFKDCLKQGLLKETPPSEEKASRSIQQSEKWLAEAKQTLKGKAYSACVVSAYLSMFHAARSILFKNGYREKSHACLARYLEHLVETRKLERKWVDLLDHLREIRHEDQYSLAFFSTNDEALKSIDSAEQFLKRMRKLLISGR